VGTQTAKRTRLNGQLRARRRRLGLTADELAVRLGCSSASILWWERNGKLPKNRLTRAALLEALGLDADKPLTAERAGG